MSAPLMPLIRSRSGSGHKLIVLTATLLLILISACSAQSDSTTRPFENTRSFTATLLRVIDGDSLLVRDRSGKKHRLRLAGIDAPESEQAGGPAATRTLRRLLGNSPMRITVGKTDRYKRLIADVRIGQQDVNLAMIAAGMAWFYRRYERELPRTRRETYAAAERSARAQKRGLWGQTEPQPPWAFRRKQRQRS